MKAIVGIDAGGTKTRGALVAVDGRRIAEASAGPANYQVVGMAAATAALRAVIDVLFAKAHELNMEVGAAGIGIAGLDRPKDGRLIRCAVEEILPRAVPFKLVNDAYLVLRAGSAHGVGLGIVSGTGCNTVGVGRDGNEDRLGGYGTEYGDYGSGDQIGTRVLQSAFRGNDGRGPTTRLTRLLMEELSIERLSDAVDRFIPDSEGSRLEVSQLAPLAFAAAREGDEVAQGILQQAGKDLGMAARLLADRLFSPQDAFPVVLGGSVLQRGEHDAMRLALALEVRSSFPKATFTVLEAEPVDGSILHGFDLVGATWSTESPRSREFALPLEHT